MQIADGHWEAVLGNAQRIEIRAAQPRDASAVRGFFESLSEDSRLLRYHSPVPIVRQWMITAVVCNDHDQRDALIALNEGRVVGVAEWGRERPDGAVAHVAVAVEESFRRRGVARELIRHLVADARSRGVEEFVASIMTANRPTMALIQDVAPQRRTRFDGTTVEVRIPLSATA